jgi:hypothetical protein
MNCSCYGSCIGFDFDAGLVSCAGSCVGGRAAPGMTTLSKVDGSAGSWVSRMAELEASAVHAFSQLSDELRAHGLEEFAFHALTAAQQEVRHATEVTRLALHLGHCPRRNAILRTPLRSLEEVAIDNAGEGCGRELLGALINVHQARTATDPLVRQTMSAIAADEMMHARFSFELAGTLMPRLTPAARRRAREAQELRFELLAADSEPREAVRVTLGLMDETQRRETARRLLETSRLS